MLVDLRFSIFVYNRPQKTAAPSHPISQRLPLWSGTSHARLTLCSQSTLQLTYYSDTIHPTQTLDDLTLSCSYSYAAQWVGFELNRSRLGWVWIGFSRPQTQPIAQRSLESTAAGTLSSVFAREVINFASCYPGHGNGVWLSSSLPDFLAQRKMCLSSF